MNNIFRRILNSDCYKLYRAVGSLLVFGFIFVFLSKANAANTESVPMYRMYNTNSGEHFYTADRYEKGSLINSGWTYEGVGWMAPVSSSVPVYRLYNANAGDHHYTMDVNEKNSLVAQGWSDEGIGWYSDENNTVPILRQYNRNNIAGAHNYTVNNEEKEYLISVGWDDEGIGWYGTDTGEEAQITAKSEGQLRDIASGYGNVCIWGYADYDGDGSGEAFFVTEGNRRAGDGEYDFRANDVIYINETGSVYYMIYSLGYFADYSDTLGCVRIHQGKGFFWFDYGAHGSGWQTILLSVKDGRPYELDISRNIQGFYRDDIGIYYLRSDYSQGFHDYIIVDLIYDANTQQFTKGGTRGSIFQ